MKCTPCKSREHFGQAFVALIIAVLLLASTTVQADVADMENLTLSPESAWDGTDSWNPSVHTPGTDILNNTFTSGPATFHNLYTVDRSQWGDYPYWENWGYSNMSDTTTPDFTNQYSAITGAGQGGSDNYGIYYDGYLSDPNAATVTFDQATLLDGAYITNMTYPYLSMLNGDSFAKKFGGTSGDDPDYLLLTIEGLDAADTAVASVDFYLADFRDTDNSNDYIVDDWRWVDLDSLGSVNGLRFSFTSTDIGDFGINTPLYFAMDNLTTLDGNNGTVGVPEPSAILIGLAGFVLLAFQWRRRK